MESTKPLGKNLEPQSEQCTTIAPVAVAPVIENSKIAFSRTNSIDSNVSAAQQDGGDLFAKQRNSARSTKSALSILLAAESEKMRAESVRMENNNETEWGDGATGSNIGSSIDTSNLSRSPSNPSEVSHGVDMYGYGQPIRRTGSGSQCVSRSKSHSRSNSLSQSSMHSLSDSSIQHERGVRIGSMTSMDRKSPFCELAASQQDTDQSVSAPHDHHDHHDYHHHHTNASESARRILASASFDSDLSDGGLGAEFAGSGSGSDAGSHEFSASDDEDVQEFDEFADFNAFDHINGDLHRSGSSGFSNIERVFSASADSFDRAPTTDKLTVKHLVTTILSNELLFQPKSAHSKHKENIATKFLKTSRDSIIGSFTSAKHSILHAHLGLNNESNGTIHSENSDASSVLSTLQQNLANAASSLPKNMQKKGSKPTVGGSGSAQQLSAQQQEQRDIEALLRTRLCLYPAEDDGTPMDDLPEFSGANDILQSGIDDMALMDKVSKTTLLQLHIAGRLEDQSMMLDNLDDSAYYDHQYDSYAVLSPTERAVLGIDANEQAAGGAGAAGRKSEKTGTTDVSFSFADKEDVFQKSRHRPTVGTTMEVLKYDTNDLSLNPVNALGYEDRYHSSDGESSSDSCDLRGKFSRERSSSNNDIIQMFRTETDDMLQEKIEAALAEEKEERERIKSQSKSARNSEESQLDPQNALKDRDDHHSRERERAKRKVSSESDEKTTTYITITGRRSADEEWRVVMKIPVRNGRPVVTLPTTAPATNKAQDTSPNRKADPFVPNSRDIAINTPKKQQESAKKPSTPSPMPPGRRSHFNSFDLDSATSAAVQAHLNPDFRERKSDTALNSAELFPANFAPNPTTPGHQRNRSYDFANFSGKCDNSSPLPGGAQQDAEEEDPGFERRHSNNSQRIRDSASRSKSIDENPGAYLLNPHTSSSAINFFAMSASASNTPTNTSRKTLSASATHSNNSSGSNLKAALLGATGAHANSSSLSPKGMPPDGHGFDMGPYPVYVHHPVPLHDHSANDGHDTIQISRHSRSNSILSQYTEQHQDLSGTATNRSSISSELSEGSCFSQLHQQLLAAQPSRNSSRSGSVNFINSANLAGGGFSSDDCSDGGSSSSGSDFDALADAAGDYDSHHHRHSGRHSGHGVGDGHAHHSHAHRRNSDGHKTARKSTERGKNLPPIDTSINSHHSSHHSSHNSSGNRSPAVKENSPTNKTSPVPGQSAQIAPGVQGLFPSSDNTDEASEGASTTGQGEKSSFYFLSRLFGTFRRSTATAITPRASAVNIGIIHEAEFEDSDSSGSNHSSVKEDNAT